MGDLTEYKYVPILKWRAGEKLALKELSTDLKEDTLPLIELVNDEGDNPDDLSKDIAANWKYPAYLDVHYRQKHIGKNALDNIADHINTGVDVIPVVWLDSPQIILDAALKVVGMCHNGAAVRINVYDELDFKSLEDELQLILKSLRLQKHDADLIIDFRYLDDTENHLKLLKKIASSLDASEWRRIVLASSAFPQSLSKCKVNADNFLPRLELELWRDAQTIFKRPPVYSDYTVRNPENIDKAGLPSISVRYTLETEYQVFRGKLNDEHFKYMAHGLNIIALYGGDFNTSYSWGDQFINARADELETCLANGEEPSKANLKPGGFKNWIAASINHHMTVVLRENLSQT